jgi:hypothetical protein
VAPFLLAFFLHAVFTPTQYQHNPNCHAPVLVQRPMGQRLPSRPGVFNPPRQQQPAAAAHKPSGEPHQVSQRGGSSSSTSTAAGGGPSGAAWVSVPSVHPNSAAARGATFHPSPVAAAAAAATTTAQTSLMPSVAAGMRQPLAAMKASGNAAVTVPVPASALLKSPAAVPGTQLAPDAAGGTADGAAARWRPPSVTGPASGADSAGASGAAAAASNGPQLCFPGPDAVVAAPRRAALIPTAPGSGAAYQAAVGGAMVEEINLRLAELARRFHGIVQQQAAASGEAAGAGAGQQKRPPPQGQWPGQGRSAVASATGAAVAGGRPGFAATPEVLDRLTKACHRAGLSYHPGSSLKVWRDISQYYQRASTGGRGSRHGKGRGKGRRRGSRGRDDNGDEEEAGGGGGGEDEGPKTTHTLILAGNVDRRRHRCVEYFNGPQAGAWLACAQRSCTAGQLWGSAKAATAHCAQIATPHKTIALLATCTLIAFKSCPPLPPGPPSRKHELWVISSQPLLASSQRGHWVALARSAPI